MTKTNKTLLLVTLGIVFILALTVVATSQTAFAATSTAEEPTGYYFKNGDQIVENNTIHLKRGKSSGPLTYWHDGEQQDATFMIMPQTIAETYLVLHGNSVSARMGDTLSYTHSETPYLVCLSSNGLSYLNVQIIPDDTVNLYNTGHGPFTFTTTGINDIQTIDGITEEVMLTIKVSNTAGQSQIISLKPLGDYGILTLSLGVDYIAGKLDIEALSLTYMYGEQSIVYSVEDYPELFNTPKTYAYTYFEGGNGTTADPYTIAQASQLNYIKYLSRYDGQTADYIITANFKLISDIDMSNIQFESILGYFQGTFDGDNHTIKNLQKISSATGANYGLFEHIGAKGIVKNVNMENVVMNVTTDYSVRMGAIAAYNFGTITGCIIKSGLLYSKYQLSDMGGIAGFNAGGTITNCTNNAQIKGCGSIGGITGTNGSGGTVTNSHNSGEITLILIVYNKTYYTGDAGGVVGRNTNESTIDNCSNAGKIVYGGPENSSTQIKPNMAQIVGWLQSGTVSNSDYEESEDYVDYSLLSKSQRQYCSYGEYGNPETTK